MLRDKEHALRIEELPIPHDSAIVGVPLRDTTIRDDTDALVIALRDRDGKFVYNPPSSFVLEGGMTLILMAKSREVKRLQAGLSDGTLGKRKPPSA